MSTARGLSRQKTLKDLEALIKTPWATWGRRETSAAFAKRWRQQCSSLSLFKNAVKFHWVLDAARATVPEVVRTVMSVQAQSYDNWSLTLACSAQRWTELGLNGPQYHHLESVELFEAERDASTFVAAIDAGDVLSPVAGYLLAVEREKHPQATSIQSNEAIFDRSDSRLCTVIQKRPANLFDLQQFDSVGRLWAVRADTVADWKLWQTERAFLLDYFSTDRCSAACASVLYYRERANFDPSLRRGGSASVLHDHIERIKLNADVVAVDTAFGKYPRIRARLDSTPRVTAVVCFRDRASLMQECLAGLELVGRDYPLDVVLVDNNSTASQRHEIDQIAGRSSLEISIVDFAGQFNFGAINNLAVARHTSSPVLLLLNNDVVLGPSIDLAEWVAWAMQPDAGTVGILLRYPNGQVQHAGMRAYFGGEARLVRVANLKADDPISVQTREVFANTFAAVMVRREVYQRVGGLRELEMVNGFGDLAFNFECLRLGLHNRFLGHFEAIHAEGATRGKEFEYWEERTIEGEYPELLVKMLREDHGWDRKPNDGLFTMVWQWAKVTARERELLGPGTGSGDRAVGQRSNIFLDTFAQTFRSLRRRNLGVD